MNNLNKIFQKQGGLKLIRQYFRSGSLLTAIGEFILLGKSRTALEILRLSTQLKTKQKLYKKYRRILRQFDRDYNDELYHQSSNKVWICWFQGIENAPEIVRKCYKSIQETLSDREIILITEKNMQDYVQFPDYIIEKWKKGIITNTHLTDLLRLELLIQYGGLWLDATVLCTSNNIPEYILNSDLFFYQCLKPGRDGHSQYISSWLINAKTNNKILMITKELCYEYWKKNNFIADYFLLHDFMSIVLDFYPNDWERIVPVCNSTPHILLLRLFEKYNEETWNAIKEMTCFHKLSYKFDDKKFEISDTYYRKVILNE